MTGRAKNGFFQPFRPNTAVFENTEFCLDVKDSIILLLVLLCLLCMACAMYTMLEVRTKVVVVQHIQEEEEKRSKSAGTVSTQTATEPGQPKSVAVAPVPKRKLKSKPVSRATDEEAADLCTQWKRRSWRSSLSLYPWVSCVSCGGSSPAG